MAIDYRDLGATVVTRHGGDPDDPRDQVYNFGILGEPGREGTPAVSRQTPDKPFSIAAPHLEGKWDGKTMVCVPQLFRKVLKRDPYAQHQTKGTCGGRAARNVVNGVQVVMIAAGKRGKYQEASHAWPYYLARRKYNMLRPSGPNGMGDGVASGSIPLVLSEFGALHAQESNDEKYAGPESDALAISWGAGRHPSQDIQTLSRDNMDFDWATMKSGQNCADALAAGGYIVVSDQHGFTDERDDEGFCRRSGTWYHYHCINGVLVSKRGRRGFSYEQSWDAISPRGGSLLGDGAFPGNCFGIDWEVMDDICRRGQAAALFGFALWDDKSSVEIDWRKAT